MRVLTIIQARTGSKRLPRKVLLTINGKPLLEYIVEFLRFSRLTDELIIATTDLSEDDAIEKLCKNNHVECYRGNSNDVLRRYYECAKVFKGDLIVRITADNPLIDPTLVDEVIDICKKTGCDYASNMLHPSYPIGYLVEALTLDTLCKLNDTQKDPNSREHVTPHIRNNPHLYNVREIFAPKKLERPEWRLTVDHPEDLQLMNLIFAKLYKNGSFISYKKVVNMLDNDLDLFKINSMHY